MLTLCCASRSALAQFSILVIAALSTGGCFAEGQGPGHREQPLALNDRQEIEIGRRAYAEILEGARLVTSGPQLEQVERVGNRIARAVEIEPLQREINLHIANYPFEWEFAVIESRQINAFCMPGGKVGVFTGLLELIENDDQLAAVISHEVAHVVARHASERIARAEQLGTGLRALSYNRVQESEADHIGVFLMAFADYDPQEAITFWQIMKSARGRRAEPPEFLSDHPTDERRIEQLTEWVPKAKAAREAYAQGRVVPARR
jgi:metalloendopeptidase OMA1, mitochondrial